MLGFTIVRKSELYTSLELLQLCLTFQQALLEVIQEKDTALQEEQESTTNALRISIELSQNMLDLPLDDEDREAIIEWSGQLQDIVAMREEHL
jgi:hypothetical protein